MSADSTFFSQNGDSPQIACSFRPSELIERKTGSIKKSLPFSSKENFAVPPSISAFDLDHTLIQTNSSFLFFRYLMQKGRFRFHSLIRALLISLEYKFCHLGLQSVHFKSFNAFLKGKPLSLIEDDMLQFLEDDFYQFFYMPSFLRLRRAQHEGHHTVILSSSPSFIVGPIARYLGVSLWQSSEYEVNQEGRLSKIKTILSGEEKANYLVKFARKHHIIRDRVIAYSDSLLDLPLLSIAGKAVVVNPSRKMRRISKEKNWEVI